MHFSPTTDESDPEAGYLRVIETFQDRHPEGDGEILERAYRLAFRAHDGQKRKSGEQQWQSECDNIADRLAG